MRSIVRGFAAFVLLAISGASLRADQIFIDFETYPLGKIANGYDGWQITNPAWDQQVTTNSIAGAQSWRISSQVASTSFGDHPFTPALPGGAGESTTLAASNYFRASMLFQPLIGGVQGEGTTISIDNGTGARGNYMRIENADGTDAGWRLVVFDYINNAFTNAIVVASGLNADETHELAFDMTFNDGLANDVWQVFLDGALVYSGIGWEDFFVDAQPSNNPPIYYDRLLFRSSSPATPNAAGILFDNIAYTNELAAAEVPEPASLAVWGMLGVASAAYSWQRRRRSHGV